MGGMHFFLSWKKINNKYQGIFLGLITSWSFVTWIWNKVPSLILKKFFAFQSWIWTEMRIIAPPWVQGNTLKTSVWAQNLKQPGPPPKKKKHTRKRTLNFIWIIYWSQNIINKIYQGNFLFRILKPSEWLQVQHFMKSRFAATKMPRHLLLQQSWNDSQRIKSK